MGSHIKLLGAGGAGGCVVGGPMENTSSNVGGGAADDKAESCGAGKDVASNAGGGGGALLIGSNDMGGADVDVAGAGALFLFCAAMIRACRNASKSFWQFIYIAGETDCIHGNKRV